MLLVYTQKTTPRIIYIFKHICTHILGLELRFTTKIEEFIAHQGIKFSYGKKRLGNEFFVQSVDLLQEQGLNDLEIKVHSWEETKCFFGVSENSDLPYDIFAASFYLLSRYEEYLPHVKDDFNRFPASESLAYKEGFLCQPVVDIWAYKLKSLLLRRFPQVQFRERTPSSLSVISVSHVFNFRNKGFLRSLTGLVIDLAKLKLSRVTDRLRVVLNLKQDPYDVFDDLISFVKRNKVHFVFMFQLSDFNVHDRNINYNRLNYRSTIKYVSDYSEVGLRLGYFAIKDPEVLKTEKKRFENIIHGPIQNVINTRYNLQLPENYSYLNELEIPNDYSMGYPESMGFRAGTCTSYLFYDLNMEVTTPLRIHPYIFHSQLCSSGNREEIESKITAVQEELNQVGGTFRAIFKNRNFSEYYDNAYYYSLLKQIHGIQ
ncbi:MAG: polysaccharide deacetylase family protein [Gillisia sp.]